MTRPSVQLDLELAGLPVVVLGGGAAALGRIAALRAAGARLTVVEEQPSDAVRDLADRGLVDLRSQEPDDARLREAALVVIAAADGGTDGGTRSGAGGAADTDTDTAAGAAPADRADRLRRRAAALGIPVASAAPVGPVPAPVPGRGRVVLVGGGPGDPGLITVAGLEAVRRADVVVADRLAPLAVLDEVRPGTEIVDVAKIPGGNATPQEAINALLVRHALAGRVVVRLKGGDNFVFGRGGEEWQACAAAGVPVDVVPGLSSAVAGPALAGIPITHRTLNQGFTVVSAHVPPGDPRSTLDWAALARTGTALVVLMGVGTLPAVTAALVRHGLDPATPAATVADAGLPGQRTVRGTVGDIAARTAAEGLRAPAVTVIGTVAAFDPGGTE
ncbi:uroporphyrinogen-III C-methyltransferase [Nakamurella endophytica]|uniref:uroporphyrinogen-III C-methyltransferase n=1 Tax=Nakamurella endophytica TaxID=1748367 RepID=A0A917SL80_9ACTN|nr:uroporphyrinogen-III C-methyltransferase [Nakamurella endophytica]GGL85215.1 hypothetical protein GCM10011594_01080 [Nakamurella endophytica]